MMQQNPLKRFRAHSQRPINQSIFALRYLSQFGIGPSQKGGLSISIIAPLLYCTREWKSQIPLGSTSSVHRYHADKSPRHTPSTIITKGRKFMMALAVRLPFVLPISLARVILLLCASPAISTKLCVNRIFITKCQIGSVFCR